MLWVWILPGALLTYAVIAIPTFSPWSTSPETGPLSHYFGWGCQADFRCYDQLTFTQPFYTSVAEHDHLRCQRELLKQWVHAGQEICMYSSLWRLLGA